VVVVVVVVVVADERLLLMFSSSLGFLLWRQFSHTKIIRYLYGISQDFSVNFLSKSIMIAVEQRAVKKKT